MKVLITATLAAGTLLSLSACSGDGQAAPPASTVTETATVEVTTTVTHTPSSSSPTSSASPAATAARTVGDGIHEVGKDIPAGTYKTNGPSGEVGMCAYTFLPRRGAGLEEASGGNSLFGSGYMEVAEGQIVQTIGCTWTLER